MHLFRYRNLARHIFIEITSRSLESNYFINFNRPANRNEKIIEEKYKTKQCGGDKRAWKLGNPVFYQLITRYHMNFAISS